MDSDWWKGFRWGSLIAVWVIVGLTYLALVVTR
jgi:hypothetical protein